MGNELGGMSVWRCEKCGAVVDGKFDICMKCGNVRQREEAPEPELPSKIKADEPIAEAAPEIPVSSAPVAKKTKKKRPFLVFLLIFILVATAVAVLFVNFSKKTHEKVVALYEAGDYLGAISEAQKDLLFSDEIRFEAIKKHALQKLPSKEALNFLNGYSYQPGIPELIEQVLTRHIESYSEQKDYEYVLEIIEKYSAKSEFLGRLEPVVFEYAEYLCEGKDYTGALELLEKYSSQFEVAGIQKQTVTEYAAYLCEKESFDKALQLVEEYSDLPGSIDLSEQIRLEEAAYYVDQREYEKALEIVDGLDPEKHDLTPLYDTIYMDMAINSLENGNTTAGKASLGKIKDVPLAAEYLKAFELMEKGQLYEAAKLLKKTDGKEDSVQMTTWREIINDYSPAAADSFEAAFVRGTVEAALLGKPLDFTLEAPESMSYDVPRSQQLRGGYSVTKDTLAQCTGKDTGKLLVLWEIKDYVSGETAYYVAWDIMKYLPEEYYPFGPEEVEYVVKIACTASSEGYYNVSGERIPAVRDKVTVGCAKPGNLNSTLFGTKSLYGDHAPDQVTLYSGYVPSVISGGLPDEPELSQLIFDAMKDIVEK